MAEDIPLRKCLSLIKRQGKLGFNDNKLNIQQMVELLCKKPFGMSNVDDALLLSRYLCEDPDEPYVALNLKTSNDTSIISAILKVQLGNYKTMTAIEQEMMHDEIFLFLNKHQRQIKEVFQT